MKREESTTYSILSSIRMGSISNAPYRYRQGRLWRDAFRNDVQIYDPEMGDIAGGYLLFDGEYYGPIRFAEKNSYIVTGSKLPEGMSYQDIDIYEKKSVTTTTYPPFYDKAKQAQYIFVKKNGVIGDIRNEPDVYVKTGGKIKKLY